MGPVLASGISGSRGAATIAGLLLALASVSCLRISIAPPAVPVGLSVERGSDGGSAALELVGSDQLGRRDFARAFPASRLAITALWASRIENTTGSPRELLSPALTSVVKASGRSGRLRVQQLDLEWHPPQEFIETPRAKRPGVVRGRLVAQWRARGDSHEQPIDIRLSEQAYPGQEQAMLELIGARLLEQTVQNIARALPPAP